jgi:isoamylase
MTASPWPTSSLRPQAQRANGEDNRDGHGENYSDNFGVEGRPTTPRSTPARALRRRNMLATLFLSQGTPMLLAGDEFGHSQGGNNNAYCQDNETGWIDWETADEDLLAFTRRLIAFRKAHPQPETLSCAQSVRKMASCMRATGTMAS